MPTSSAAISPPPTTAPAAYSQQANEILDDLYDSLTTEESKQSISESPDTSDLVQESIPAGRNTPETKTTKNTLPVVATAGEQPVEDSPTVGIVLDEVVSTVHRTFVKGEITTIVGHFNPSNVSSVTKIG